MSKTGVCLGRGDPPSFGGIVPGIVFGRNTAGYYETPVGYGLYGSATMVRAMVCAVALPNVVDSSLTWATRPSGTGWTFQHIAQQIRCRIFTSVGGLNGGLGTLTIWPNANIVVYTYDGADVVVYVNGAVASVDTSPDIGPAPAGATTMQLLLGDGSLWVSHLLGSDSPGGFMDAGEVAAWTTQTFTNLQRLRPLEPWSGCDHWWDVERAGIQTWTESIGGVVATATNPGRLLKRSLPSSSIPRS